MAAKGKNQQQGKEKTDKRKFIPLILMLTAGLIASCLAFLFDFSLKKTLVVLIIVLVLFYFLGSLLMYVLMRFEQENEKAAFDEGEVIEKEGAGKPTEDGDASSESKDFPEGK